MTTVRERDWADTPVLASRALAKRLARAYTAIGLAGFGEAKIVSPTAAWDEQGVHGMSFAMPRAFATIEYNDPEVRDDGSTEVPHVIVTITLIGDEQ